MKLERYSEGQISEALVSLPGWNLRAGKLHKEFRFKDFVEAFGFMTRCALHAERMDHHPEWSNVYNTVAVELVTHDAKGITAKDFELARKMEFSFAGR